MRRTLRLTWQLWQCFGPLWLVNRLLYAAQMRTGVLRRRMPAFEWAERPLGLWLRPGVPSDPEAYQQWRQRHGGAFFFKSLPEVPADAAWDTQNAIRAADSVLEGKWQYFAHTVYDVGFPPDWHLNPMTGRRTASDRHWTQISDFGHDDIKLVWEASRFSPVYTLVRAYASTHDERYAAAFWKLVEDWAQHNPPQRGANWKCGQETAVRLMAWCFGLYGFANSLQSTPERVAFMAVLVAAEAERICGNTDYAYSTKSNHGISEAVGLWTAGLLFPEFSAAQKWQEKGRRLLENEVRRQIYPDGAYVMPSTNYYRMSLQACLWAIRLGELNDERFSQGLYALVAKGIDFLCQLLDPQTGWLPNFGSNDGALLLPLNNCDYADFRPLLQAGCYAVHRRRFFEPGPWNEDLWWLFGPEALDSAVKNDAVRLGDFAAEQGGCYTIRSEQSWAMIRCAQLTDRPSHIDQLHVDVWWKGINVACDAGTYLYDGPAPWRNGLVGTAVHNTIQVDEQEQMTQAGHFTWVDWAQGRLTCCLKSDRGQLAYWEGEHNGYQRLDDPVLHRRGLVRIGLEHWLVVDHLNARKDHRYRLHWLAPQFPYRWAAAEARLLLETPAGEYQIRSWCSAASAVYSVVVGDENSTQGWHSRCYAHKEPGIAFVGQVCAASVWFWSLLGPEVSVRLAADHSLFLSAGHWEAHVQLAAAQPGGRLVRAVSVTGLSGDHLEMES